MSQPNIRFDDGAAYERMMGSWSKLIGERFLRWLAPAPGLRWVDVGCGNGVFTQVVAERCAPSSLDGIDPFEGQIAYARQRPALRGGRFRTGDAMALPYADGAFDVSTMALVMAFIPDPAKGVAEMKRVVAPGGTVAAYNWDIFGAHFPLATLQAEIRSLGFTPELPPSLPLSSAANTLMLWKAAGLESIAMAALDAERTFVDFDDWWSAAIRSASTSAVLATMTQADIARLRARMHAKTPAGPDGRITVRARANAIRGRVPLR